MKLILILSACVSLIMVYMFSKIPSTINPFKIAFTSIQMTIIGAFILLSDFDVVGSNLLGSALLLSGVSLYLAYMLKKET